MSYKPFIYKINTIDVDDIYNNPSNNKIISSSNIEQPLFSLGFHSFIHRTKAAMAITNKLETKNKFYYVVNPFEHTINDYDKDIHHISNIFLNNPGILSRAFYKMWEILYIFDLANNTNSTNSMTMAGIAEGPGSFIQAFVEFREKYFDPSNDKVYGLTINAIESININKSMVDNINKRYDNMIEIIKTSKDVKQTSKTKLKTEIKSNGDLTNILTIKYLKDNIKTKVDLITADGGFEWKNENYQEQEAYVLILGEIIAALNIQAKDGSFVLKIFETFTHNTIKFIYLLKSFYEEVYIYKPFFSRATNSEKYIICKGFKYDNQEKLDKHIKILEDTLIKCKKVMDENKFINDIFPSFVINDEHLNIFKYININIANTQQIMINNLVVYIKSNNYFGDSYHSYREEQIKANKWWIEQFFTDKLNDKSSLIKETYKYNESELNLFVKKLV
jgi:23S rRNA U2552 (ribose-2'-O)-methylase RlmE/FtsJ